MDLLQVIIKPYLTEKTYSVREKNSREVIAFIVNPKASKNDIKNAFFLIYQIKPESINTIVRKPVEIRTGTRNPGFTKLTKIAYITLPTGVKLAVTKEEIESAKEEIKKDDSKVEDKKIVKEKVSTSDENNEKITSKSSEEKVKKTSSSSTTKKSTKSSENKK